MDDDAGRHFNFLPRRRTRNTLGKGDVTAADLCFSMQETVFAMLVEITEAAPWRTRTPRMS